MLKPNGIFINMKIGFCYFFSQISPSKMFTFSFFLVCFFNVFWGLQRSKINLTDKMKPILEKGSALYDGHSQLLTVHSKINIFFFLLAFSVTYPCPDLEIRYTFLQWLSWVELKSTPCFVVLRVVSGNSVPFQKHDLVEPKNKHIHIFCCTQFHAGAIISFICSLTQQEHQSTHDEGVELVTAWQDGNVNGMPSQLSCNVV